MAPQLKRFALGLLAGMMLIATAMPAASDEHDRPDDVPPDEPVSGIEDPAGEDEGGVGPTSHNQTGDFDDFVSIRNQTGTGLSRLNFNTTDSIVINSDTWRLANDAGTGNFLISEGGTTNRAVMRQGGNLGLGTENPLSPLHIDRTGGFQLRMQGSGADYRMDAFGTSLRIGDSSNTNQFRIFGADAPFNALTVGNGIGMGTSSPAGGLHVSNIGGAPTDALVVGNGVGIGTAAPEEALDIRNVTGDVATRFRIQHGENYWINGVNTGGNYLFAKFGTGGIEFIVRDRNHPNSTVDVQGPVQATTFKTSSSSAFKTDARAVDPLNVLASLNALPVSSWQFKSCADGEGRLPNEDGTPARPCSGPGEGPRHIGPMAEDFQEAFGLGDGESIATVDADGVIMASIQGLTQLLEEKDERIAELEEQVSDLESLESRVDALEAQLNRGLPRGAPPRP